MRTSILVLLLWAASVHAAIRGVVVDEEGAPLAGASVAAYAQETRAEIIRRVHKGTDRTPLASVKAGEDGSFQLGTERRPVVVLNITAEGRELLSFDVADGDDTGTLMLRKAKPYSGRVTAGGKPVEGAIVVYRDGAAMVRSGEDGGFSLPRSSTPGFAGVIHPQYAPADLLLAPKQKGFDVTLDRGVEVRGRVLAPDGRSAVGKAVIFGGPWILAESADDGTFTIPRVPAAWKMMRVASPLGGAMVPNNGTASYDVRLRTPGSHTGVVRDAKTNAPVPGVRYRLTVLSDEPNSEMVITNAKGEFVFRGLAPGRYGMYATHPLYAISADNLALVLAPGEDDTGVQAATPLATIRGRVVDEERKPLRGVTLAGTAFRQGGRVTATTAPDGTFLLRLRVMPQMEVRALKDGYAPGKLRLALEAGETKNVSVTLTRGVRLAIHVQDPDRVPVAEAAVVFTDAADPGRMAMPDSWLYPACGMEECVTGADGSVVARLAPGRYDITVGGASIVTKHLPAQTIETSSSPMQIVVERGVELSGRTVYSDGTPAAEVMVQVEERDAIATTDADGRFSILNAPRGTVKVVARHVKTRMESEPLEVTTPVAGVLLTVPRGGRITGRVLDAGTRDPVPDFNIHLFGADTRAAPVPIATNDGTFALEQIAPGTVTLHIVAPGYARGVVSGIDVEEGKTAESGEMALQRGAMVKGRVTSTDGKPLDGVTVRVREDEGPSGMQRWSGTGDHGISDADGVYGLGSVPPGEQTLTFSKQGFLQLEKTITTASGKELRVDAVLDSGRSVSGRVVDEAGMPVADAEVRVGQTFDPRAFARSAEDGSFTLTGLPAKEQRIMARKRGLVSGYADVDVASAGSVTLVMRRGATVNGRVTGLPADQLEGVAVFSMSRDGFSEARSGSGGTFTLTGVPDGKVTVKGDIATPDGSRSAAKEIEVLNGAAPFVELGFADGFTVSGKVLANGKPVPNAFVMFYGEGRAMPPQHTSTTAAGAYSINGLTAGTYTIRVSAMHSGDELFEESRTLSGPATIDIIVEGSSVRGRVIDASDHTPLAGAAVTLYPEASETPGGHEATTDSNGRFAIPFVRTGRWKLRAQSERYRGAEQSLTVGSGTVETEIGLERGTAAAILVVDAVTGTPVNAHLLLTDAAREVVFEGSSVASGAAARVWAAPGQYTVSAQAQGYARAEAPVIIPGPEVRIALSPAGRIAVVTRRSWRFIKVDRPNDTHMSMRPLVENLSPGTYTVQLLDENNQVLARKDGVVVQAGQTTTVSFD